MLRLAIDLALVAAVVAAFIGLVRWIDRTGRRAVPPADDDGWEFRDSAEDTPTEIRLPRILP